MKKLWVLLLGTLLLASFVQAQEEEAPAEEGTEAAKPKKEAELPTSLPPLKLEPLSSDSPILKDDDMMFDSLKDSVILSNADSIKALTLSLKRAATLMRKMKLDLEGEKLWAKQVYDIIQNYEVKYSKTLSDIKRREKKVALLVKLVGELKASTLQANVAQQLKNAKKALSELTVRSGKDAKKSKQYAGIKDQIAKLQKTLDASKPSAPHSETATQIHEILKSEVPPAAADALKSLVASEASFVETDEAVEEEQDQAEESEEAEEESEEEAEEEEDSEEEESEEEESEEEESEEEEEEEEEEAEEDAKAQW